MNKNRVHVRELRKNLKAHLSSGKTIAIGTDYDLRAFLVSIPEHERWNAAAKQKAIAAAKKSLKEAIDAEAAAD